MSTLLDLIQTKVNYVVQEAIVVIRDIFRKYPNKSVSLVLLHHVQADTFNLIHVTVNQIFFNPILLSCRYESIIATLCENLDSLDEPDARAAMIWIVGEYAERIDNADELLESFLEGFHDESTQVSSCNTNWYELDGLFITLLLFYFIFFYIYPFGNGLVLYVWF